METLELPKSVRKFIRLEKDRIRHNFLDTKKQEELITALYEKVSAKPDVKGSKEIKKETNIEKVETKVTKNKNNVTPKKDEKKHNKT